MKKGFIALLIGVVLLAGCKKVDAKKGDPTDHKVDLVGFTGVDFGLGGNIAFTESETTSIVVNTTDEVFKILEIYVENSTLKIHSQSGFTIKNSDKINITVSAPEVNRLILSGSGNFNATMDENIDKAVFDATVSGSGDMEVKGVSADKYSLALTGSGDLTFDKITGTVCSSSVSGSGNLVIASGECMQSDMVLSGSGDLKAFNMNGINTVASLSGSGSIELTASDNLNVEISGSGNIRYKGTPIITSSIPGSGNLIDAN